MKRYEWDEVLTRDDLLELTKEALAPPVRKKALIWRRLCAIAAGMVLVFCLANIGTIATGVEKLFRYISGVGVVTGGGGVLVQKEPVEWTCNDVTYRVEGAFQKDGYVHLVVEALTSAGRVGTDCTFWAKLAEDGKYLPSYLGKDWIQEGEHSTTPFMSMEEWTEKFAERGLALPKRYEEYGALAMCSMTFQEGNGQYDLFLRDDSRRTGQVLSLELTDQAEEQSATQYTMELEQGTLITSVSQDGRRIFMSLDQPPSDDAVIWRLLPQSVMFVDEEGNRYRGTTQFAHSWNRTSNEILLEKNPAAPIRSIEIGGIALISGYAEALDEIDSELNWTIDLQ
ncbi:hypothetical protein [Clostridium sp. D33t1_170424_F3]|uniref:hypothetical protein n=1 Tax=Clostridium sp. D33t1_170424_F3 TaxID=2787099 RepID=UPI0018AB3DD1|nr:hypothetical protein [Clostridium sp. D33t1_170424_F3]